MVKVKWIILMQKRIRKNRKINKKSFPIISSAKTKDALVERISIPFQLAESLETF